MLYRANLFNGAVNHSLQILWRNVTEGFASFADGLMENSPAERLVNELRNVTLFHAFFSRSPPPLQFYV